jgi:Dolichyl-phosphate-mannose-protein mannosyltransferase
LPLTATKMTLSSMRLALILVLCVHAALLVWAAAEDSPVVDEVNHLPAGLSHLYFGRFDLYRVNPPLVRTVAALPVAMLSPKTDWQRYDCSPIIRPDLEAGQDFLKVNGSRSLWFFTLARWACIPFSILGGYICFRWARELYGVAAGFAALILWCFCPYILGHGSLFTPDAHAAAMGVTAYYLFWRWLNRLEFGGILIVGIVSGLTELTKFTLLVFYPLWILTWFIYRLPELGLRTPKQWLQEGGALATMLCLSVVVINLGYFCEGSLQPIGAYRFQSRLLSGVEPKHGANAIGNRFAGTWLASLPVPLPANFVQGIDAQRLDFERGLPSYLHGEWSEHGWWYYYLYALAIKLPLGTLGLIALSVPCAFWKTYRSTWRNELVLLLPILTILTLVSSQTGFSVHSRYVIPALPFAYIWCSKLARSLDAKRWAIAGVSAALLCWSVGSSLWYYPHSLSYFNELVGGPMGGHAHLLDSNIAWGQDLYFLKRWYDEHPDARPFHLACYSLMDPRLAGIEFSLPPVGPAPGTPMGNAPADRLGPLSGWYAVDMNHLHGAKLTAMDGRGEWQSVASDGYDLTYFQRFEPVAMAGYSIYIYQITPEEANRVRRELGLRELSEPGK